MNEKPQPPSATHLHSLTIQGLDQVVSAFYLLLRAGKIPGNSHEADQALKALRDFVSENLECDPEAVTWKERNSPSDPPTE